MSQFGTRSRNWLAAESHPSRLKTHFQARNTFRTVSVLSIAESVLHALRLKTCVPSTTGLENGYESLRPS